MRQVEKRHQSEKAGDLKLGRQIFKRDEEARHQGKELKKKYHGADHKHGLEFQAEVVHKDHTEEDTKLSSEHAKQKEFHAQARQAQMQKELLELHAKTLAEEAEAEQALIRAKRALAMAEMQDEWIEQYDKELDQTMFHGEIGDSEYTPHTAYEAKQMATFGFNDKFGTATPKALGFI